MKRRSRVKKITVFLVMATLVLLMASSTALAEDGVKLTASTVTGNVGEKVTVSISITNAEDTEGGQLDLSFDDDIIEPVSAARGSFLPDADNHLFNHNLNLEDGKIRIIWVVAEGSELDEGVVGTVVFDVLEEGVTDLTFSGVVIAPEGVDVGTHTAGKVTAEDYDEEALKQKAIKAADDAIAALPDLDDLTLADKTKVEEARALVKKAKDDHEAEDDDFADLDRLVDAEKRIAKLEAIKAADDAILALPSLDSLDIDDKPDVVAARALVNKAKSDHGAVDGDFVYLSRLVSAENRIKELEGVRPTPPTGATRLWVPALALFGLASLFYLFRRRSVTIR